MNLSKWNDYEHKTFSFNCIHFSSKENLLIIQCSLLISRVRDWGDKITGESGNY